MFGSRSSRGHRQDAQTNRPRARNQERLGRGYDLTAPRNGMTAGSHDVQKQRRVGKRKIGGNREEDGFMYEFIGAIAAILRKSHIGALVQALVGRAAPTGTALPAKVHKEDNARRFHRRSGVRAGCNNDTCRLMAGRYA